MRTWLWTINFIPLSGVSSCCFHDWFCWTFLQTHFGTEKELLTIMVQQIPALLYFCELSISKCRFNPVFTTVFVSESAPDEMSCLTYVNRVSFTIPIRSIISFTLPLTTKTVADALSTSNVNTNLKKSICGDAQLAVIFFPWWQSLRQAAAAY